MDKVLTVIIPTYNMENYLHKCLDSLIIAEELMSQLEVLVINDGSKDRSSDIAHSYQDKYPDIFRVIDKENGNYGSCVNRGLKEAKGKYIKILDADDSFDNTCFESYLLFLSKLDVDMVVNDFVFVNENDEITQVKRYSLGKIGKEFEFSKRIGRTFYRKNLHMHAVAYKTENLRSHHYIQTEGISYTDQEWTYTPLFFVRKIAYFNGLLYRYLLGRKGQTVSTEVFNKNVFQDETCVLRKLEDYIKQKAVSDGGGWFLEKWIKANVEKCYRRYLVSSQPSSYDRIIDLDKKFMSLDSSVKSMVESLCLPFTNYKYIKIWHKEKESLSGILFTVSKYQSRIITDWLRKLKLYNR